MVDSAAIAIVKRLLEIGDDAFNFPGVAVSLEASNEWCQLRVDLDAVGGIEVDD